MARGEGTGVMVMAMMGRIRRCEFLILNVFLSASSMPVDCITSAIQMHLYFFCL